MHQSLQSGLAVHGQSFQEKSIFLRLLGSSFSVSAPSSAFLIQSNQLKHQLDASSELQRSDFCIDDSYSLQGCH